MKTRVEKKPWGSFEEFCKNEECTVKIVTVDANEELSLQYHRSRDEFWRILEGNPKIVVGEKTKEGSEGDEFFIPRGTRHRISAGKETATVLEISFGEFDEKDIVRVEDKYGRNQKP